MTDSARPPLQPQVKSLAEQLAELEDELQAIREPCEEDYELVDYERAKRIYRAEIAAVWQKIHKLVLGWPRPV